LRQDRLFFPLCSSNSFLFSPGRFSVSQSTRLVCLPFPFCILYGPTALSFFPPPQREPAKRLLSSLPGPGLFSPPFNAGGNSMGRRLVFHVTFRGGGLFSFLGERSDKIVFAPPPLQPLVETALCDFPFFFFSATGQGRGADNGLGVFSFSLWGSLGRRPFPLFRGADGRWFFFFGTGRPNGKLTILFFLPQKQIVQVG